MWQKRQAAQHEADQTVEPSMSAVAAGVRRSAGLQVREQSLARLRHKHGENQDQISALIRGGEANEQGNLNASQVARQINRLVAARDDLENEIHEARGALAPLRTQHALAVHAALAPRMRQPALAALEALAALRCATAQVIEGEVVLRRAGHRSCTIEGLLLPDLGAVERRLRKWAGQGTSLPQAAE